MILNKSYFHIFMGFTILIAIAGCDTNRSSSGVKEKARAEMEIGQELERERQRQKATAMEAELVRRKRLYEKMAGEFQGETKVKLFEDESKLYTIAIQLIFNPQLPADPSGRLRELTEIESDLNDLKHLVHGNIEIRASRYPYMEGCDFEVRQVYKTGKLYLRSESCNFFVDLYLGTGKKIDKQEVVLAESSKIAEQIMSGQYGEVKYLVGRGYFSQTGESFSIQLRRSVYSGGR